MTDLPPVSDLPPPPLWERMPEEPSRWYARFESFRLARPSRSLLGVFNADKLARGQPRTRCLPGAWAQAAYLCDHYCQILADSGRGGTWVPFLLWPEQRRVAGLLQEHRLVVVLKARQLGLTWLVLAFALWLMLFQPIATVLLFSRRDEEAT